MTGRPDLEGFVVGDLYVCQVTDELVEYLGMATGDLGEDVGVFRFVPHGGCLIATQRGYDRGEVFQPAGEVAADELT